jgi:hypothetical protein
MNFWKKESRHVDSKASQTDDQRQDVCQHFVGTPYNFVCCNTNTQILVNQQLIASVFVNSLGSCLETDKIFNLFLR